MTTHEQRIECLFNDPNVTVKGLIQDELDIIDGLGGTLISYVEYFNGGMNNIVATFIYTLP